MRRSSMLTLAFPLAEIGKKVAPFALFFFCPEHFSVLKRADACDLPADDIHPAQRMRSGPTDRSDIVIASAAAIA